MAIAEAVACLSAAAVPSPRVDAETLAAHVLGTERGRIRALLAMNDNETLLPPRFGELVAQRVDRVPLQHLTGVAHFRYLNLLVGPGVFVPRPETETVAQLAIDAAREAGDATVVDLGTGSGAIAASVAHEVPGATVVAVELDELAHAWAQRNLAGLSVELIHGDLRDALGERNATFDVVVSNPPYIPSTAVPQDPEVANHDPRMALYGGGEDGMELPRATMATAARLLRSGGYFVMEHAEVQAHDMVAELESTSLWEDIRSHSDLNDRARATSAVRRVAQTIEMKD
ncbi:peptide chain release factor N(5)-glutamine methyltransferase [Arthrobacter roseus]|uniref:peptide chain release factor N(5)-glutamine methyltransferase n=1 Tax=Arthrobacter roseus TaxID=136274 RepID=UPI0019668488|nr:peptide chain release factor N(5)-glutamine methyltransferase [Arthrobacter roseus]